MLRNIFLVSLLVYAVCAAHWQIREVDSAEDQNEDMCADGIPNMCETCKTITEKVKKHVFRNSKPDVIKATLKKVCEEAIIPLNHLCNCLVKKYLDGLINELMTDDGPNTICTKIHACKPKPPIKEFIVVCDQAHDNF